MSVSGTELLRRVKSRIDEIDPSEVKELIGEGVPIVDVRGSEEFATATFPAPRAFPAATWSRASGRRTRSLGPADPVLRLGRPLGLRARARSRRTWATNTSAR